MAGGEAGEGDAWGERMAMDPQQIFLVPQERLVKHDVIRTNDFPGAGNIDPNSEDSASVYGIWVWVMDAERGDTGAEAIEVCCVVGEL